MGKGEPKGVRVAGTRQGACRYNPGTQSSNWQKLKWEASHKVGWENKGYEG